MFRLGLTGGIGSGKSLVADMLQELGAAVIDTDRVAHELTAPGGQAIALIREAFGADVIRADGAMDRDRMRALVFEDPPARKTLEAIIHPLIRKRVGELANEATGCYTVFVVPLLIESGRWRHQVDRVCVVDCDRQTQIDRVVSRNGLALQQIEKILAAQATRQERLDHADDVITNDGQTTRESVREQVLVLHQRWCNLAAC
ncbi:dephospho-CoA kinase [Orrella marina]|uniref:Dephospho-CoA kinase n=1 Tax=Orrella marina TaxID=2163011 RepID=A0A2R4XMW1_9BURK|nr:dephospho-CoA kinase [Orrella marina]AWB35137.1 dephospho-CoA kinase [Orrella marina]